MIYKIIFTVLFFLAITNFGGESAVWRIDGDGDPVHSKIPHHSPEWTNLNESDPGVTEATTHANENSVIERE